MTLKRFPLQREPSGRSSQSWTWQCSRCRSCGGWLRMAAPLPLLPPPSPRPPSHPARSFSSAELSLAPLWPQGGIQRGAPVCEGGGRAPEEEKLAPSSSHVLCCCCFLKEGCLPACLTSREQNYAFARSAPAQEHHLPECQNTECAKTSETTGIMAADPSSIVIFWLNTARCIPLWLTSTAQSLIGWAQQ